MQSNLRIAIVCDAIDDDSLGGSFISAKRFGAGFAKAGHEIIWITSKFADTSKRKNFSYAKIYEFPHTPRLGSYGIHFAYTSLRRLYKIFQQEKIDIVYSIQPSIIAWQSLRAAKRLHIPIVSHSHTLPELFVPRAPKFVQKLIKKIVKKLYKNYDGLIYSTLFVQKKYDDFGFTMKQTIIGNGVDTKIFTPNDKYHSDVFGLLSVGRLDQGKNSSLLIEALHLLDIQNKLCANIHCTIVGGGPMQKKLIDLTKKYALSKTITFADILPAGSARLVKIFQEASVFVLPSLYETEGIVVLEAMACGCPLLVSDSPHSAAKQFVQNNGYRFEHKNPQDLADKIEKLYLHPEIVRAMRLASMQNVQEFSFALSIQKLEAFFHSFIHHT